MASIAFAGTTLWQDGSGNTGRNQVRVGNVGEVKRLVFEPVPRYGGDIAKDLGAEPQQIFIECDYILGSSAVDTLKDAIKAKIGSVGTLTYPPNESVQYCRLVNYVLSKGPTTENAAGTIEYLYTVSLQFKSLRPNS